MRINVLGASGSGASTSGRAVAKALSLPYFDGDDYYHAPSDPPFQNPREPQARHDMLVADLAPLDSWVLAGGLVGWDPQPQLGLTLVVFLWVPIELRMERLRIRERELFGARLLEGGDMFTTHQEFLAWAAGYDVGDIEGKTLQRHEAFLAQQTCRVVEVRGVHTVEHITAQVLKAVA